MLFTSNQQKPRYLTTASKGLVLNRGDGVIHDLSSWSIQRQYRQQSPQPSQWPNRLAIIVEQLIGQKGPVVRHLDTIDLSLYYVNNSFPAKGRMCRPQARLHDQPHQSVIQRNLSLSPVLYELKYLQSDHVCINKAWLFTNGFILRKDTLSWL